MHRAPSKKEMLVHFATFLPGLVDKKLLTIANPEKRETWASDRHGVLTGKTHMSTLPIIFSDECAFVIVPVSGETLSAVFITNGKWSQKYACYFSDDEVFLGEQYHRYYTKTFEGPSKNLVNNKIAGFRQAQGQLRNSKVIDKDDELDYRKWFDDYGNMAKGDVSSLKTTAKFMVFVPLLKCHDDWKKAVKQDATLTNTFGGGIGGICIPSYYSEK